MKMIMVIIIIGLIITMLSIKLALSTTHYAKKAQVNGASLVIIR
jgi:uncharacterized membrane protein